ncbi:MAG: hypothetical protein K6A93_01510 [Bacteroidaceae bacterium]|nr:hypothetical protein [Bacteroidaceae bacterium]
MRYGLLILFRCPSLEPLPSLRVGFITRGGLDSSLFHAAHHPDGGLTIAFERNRKLHLYLYQPFAGHRPQQGYLLLPELHSFILYIMYQ